MKTCTKCGEEKPVADFYVMAGKTHSWCKECFLAYMADRHKKSGYEHQKRAKLRKREWIISYLQSHPCVDCGNPDIRVLEFDHRDPSEKKFNVSRLVSNNRSLKTLQEEVEKCDVRCANCHRIRTGSDQGWLKAQ